MPLQDRAAWPLKPGFRGRAFTKARTRAHNVLPATGDIKMIQNFLTFDKLIGTSLIKVLYYIGLAGIALYTVVTVLAGLGMMFTQSFGGGLLMVIAALFGLVISLLFWRFICEIYILFFRISDDLRDIKNMKDGPSAP